MRVDALSRERTPERPGPGPLPETLLRALDLTIGRRVEGLLAGDYRATVLGLGTELAQVRPYVPGDDVRRMDWNVTARTRVPHVRVDLAERVMTTWLVLDTSASMSFGTADRRKADVAEGVRLGVFTFGTENPRILPPRQGRSGLLGLLTALHEETPAESGPTSFARAFRSVAGASRQRALVAIVSDFRGPHEWRESLLALAGRHDVLAIEIRDPREQVLPDVGELWLVDPETGRRLRVNTKSQRLRDRFEEAAEGERAALRRMLAGLGVRHVVLSTSGDWLRTLVPFLKRGRAVRR
jgi:uncharacterized protein (DUF58 family)